MNTQLLADDRTSARIVDFISKLIPIYHFELHDNQVCARSLCDGTLIRPLPEQAEDQDGMIEVLWQGDPSRTTIVKGAFMARLAIQKYVEHRTFHNPASLKEQVTHLAAHFQLKTGESLGMDLDCNGLAIQQFLGDLTKKFGVNTVIEIVKKSAET